MDSDISTNVGCLAAFFTGEWLTFWIVLSLGFGVTILYLLVVVISTLDGISESG